VAATSREDLEDADLARALIAGEPWAATVTWNRYAPAVYGIASRALGRASDAEDVTQEVFYRLFCRIGTLRQPDALRAFVTSFALRIVKWELRRRRTRRWLMLSDSSELPETGVFSGDPEARQALERFYAVLDRLGTRERLVFTLRHLESMTLEEIATALGISLSTVKRSLARATERVSLWVSRDKDLAGYFERPAGGRDEDAQ
jgi:RNA polymerase sigma-70 factor (ECF subfamily)